MSRLPMSDLIVVLPGIVGSVLKKDGRVVWGYSAGTIARALFSLGESLGTDLALPKDDPEIEDLGDGITADALMPDFHLLPGIWKIDGYSKAVETVNARFAVTDGENYFQLPYDWRRDNRVAARRLARDTHRWLAAWRKKSGNDDAKLILIGHSMGGLVSRYFLECLEGWKETRALVTFGTPYRGSLNALDGLANGMKKWPFDFSSVGRQFTSIYQLLPIYKCYDPGDGKLIRVAEAVDIPNIDRERASAALVFHREIEAAVVSRKDDEDYRRHGYDIHPIVGIAQTTSLSARRDGAHLEMLDTYDGADTGGDGTVPRVSAIPIELSDRPSSAVYVGTQHGSLQNAEASLTHLIGVLSGLDLDLGEFKKPRAQVSLEVPDINALGQPLTVRARATRPGTELTARLWQHGNDSPLAIANLGSGDGWLDAEFAPSQAGLYRVSVGGKDANTAEDALVVLDPGAGSA